MMAQPSQQNFHLCLGHSGIEAAFKVTSSLCTTIAHEKRTKNCVVSAVSQ